MFWPLQKEFWERNKMLSYDQKAVQFSSLGFNTKHNSEIIAGRTEN